MKKLKFLGERCPTWLKQFKKELYLKVWLVFFFFNGDIFFDDEL